MININYQDMARRGWLNRDLVFEELVVKNKNIQKMLFAREMLFFAGPIMFGISGR